MADQANLPEHVLHQIFLRMPTKPLMQLKCLSKQCNRMISDPSFMKSRSRRMIFLPGLPLHTIDNPVTGAAPSMIKLRFPFGNPKRVTIVGSINGIVLLVLRGVEMNNRNLYPYQLILFNPFTGEFKTVPDHPQPFATDYVYGFGYGTTKDDLKIVRLINSNSFNGCREQSFQIFSLKTWSWTRPTKLTGDYRFFSYSGTFANGFLYWMAGKTSLFPLIILVFDIKNMVFSEMKIRYGWLISLGTYKGRLCMVCLEDNDNDNDNECELHVMNEHGVGQSWSTVCRFKSVFPIKLLCVLDDGKLLLLKSPQEVVLIYDMFKDSYQEVSNLTSFDPDYWWLEAREYVESSISLSDICSPSI